MSESETQQITAEAEVTTGTATTSMKKGSRLKWMIGAVVTVVLIVLGVLYQLEKEGRSPTHLFTSIIERQEANRIVATVNGEVIKNAELQTSIKQFTQIAEAQGMEATGEDIKNQALEVLINTSLLKQEATARGISITDEDVTERVSGIQEEIGGAEVLQERMSAIGIDAEQLQSDVKDELLIQKLLDQVFADAKIEITDEEVVAVYDGAGGTEAGLPALEEVRPQIEAQINSQKEQAAIDGLLTSLKDKAEIDIKESK